MSPVEEQILETWRIHNRLLLFLIQHLPKDSLSVSLSTRGGRDVARQLAHCHNVREGRLGSFAKKAGMPLSPFDSKYSPTQAELMQAIQESSAVMEAFIHHSLTEKEGKATGFKKGIVPMIGYYISHESHHRGNILLSLKQSGIRLPDTLRWGLWEWNKDPE